jgi:hypothetical protein
MTRAVLRGLTQQAVLGNKFVQVTLDEHPVEVGPKRGVQAKFAADDHTVKVHRDGVLDAYLRHGGRHLADIHLVGVSAWLVEIGLQESRVNPLEPEPGTVLWVRILAGSRELGIRHHVVRLLVVLVRLLRRNVGAGSPSTRPVPELMRR